MIDILGVIRARLARDVELTAERRGADLDEHLLERVRVVGEAFAVLASWWEGTSGGLRGSARYRALALLPTIHVVSMPL